MEQFICNDHHNSVLEICPYCRLEKKQNKLDSMTDKDLAPVKRTWANLWFGRYMQATEELRKANKGIRRLKNKLARIEKRRVEELRNR